MYTSEQLRHKYSLALHAYETYRARLNEARSATAEATATRVLPSLTDSKATWIGCMENARESRLAAMYWKHRWQQRVKAYDRMASRPFCSCYNCVHCGQETTNDVACCSCCADLNLFEPEKSALKLS